MLDEKSNDKLIKFRRPLSDRRWSLILAVGAALVMVAIALTNYIVDPYSYFHPTASQGSVDYIPGETYNLRLFNYEYFKENHSKYKGVILGGSKGGYVSEARLSELSGLPCYSLTAEHGNFHDYLDWVRWLAKNTQIELIFLNLSTLEVDFYTEEERNAQASGYYQPAALDREKNKFVEFVQYLYRGGIGTSLDFLKAKKGGTLCPHSMEEAKAQGLYGQMEARKLDPQGTIGNVNASLLGMLDFAAEGNHNDMPAIARNLAAIREIKQICDHAGIALKMVFASTYVVQYLSYESPEYWEYLRAIADITDYWDFSFPNKYNRNPYNFYDAWHAHADILSRMMEQAYGELELKDFGVHVTADNVDAHIEKRRRSYERLMAEYKNTGGIALGSAFDDSYLLGDLVYPSVSNMGSQIVPGLPLGDYLRVEQHFYAGFGQLQGVGIFVEGLLEEKEARGMLYVSLYDDTGRHKLYDIELDTKSLRNGSENILRFDNIELVEGHWYSFIFSYQPKTGQDPFSLVFVDGAATEGMYADVDGVTYESEAKMNIYRRQAMGSYLAGEGRLKTDQMRGEGEGKTRSISNKGCYVQTFTAGCDWLSYMQIKAFPKQESGQADGSSPIYPEENGQADGSSPIYPEESGQADGDYPVCFELKDSKGNRMGSKTVMAGCLWESDTYDLIFDGDICLHPGETYELSVYAGQMPEQGLKLLTHAAEKEQGSVLYFDGKDTGESLCYRIYGLDKDEMEEMRNAYGWSVSKD